MDQRYERRLIFDMRLWMLLFSVALVVLVLLEGLSYIFNWTWTGFEGNTLWDWMRLLVLPVSLTGATVWSGTRQKWGTSWTMVLVLVLAALVVCAIGGYFLNWTWTGFAENKLWDWIGLLVLPITLTSVTIWFGAHGDELRRIEQEKQTPVPLKSPGERGRRPGQ
ncbi:MAG TPA: hypothetical protein VH540_20120 [Ktedonobacterales bacterium]